MCSECLFSAGKNTRVTMMMLSTLPLPVGSWGTWANTRMPRSWPAGARDTVLRGGHLCPRGEHTHLHWVLESMAVLSRTVGAVVSSVWVRRVWQGAA